MLEIKNIKNTQVFYGKSKEGEPHRFKAFGDAFLSTQVWTVECTDEGDYIFRFNQDDQHILYPTADLK